MAKRKPSQPPAKPLSDLANWMISAYGIQRLSLMRSEYEADLPPDMPKAQRLQRIEAINEILPKTRKL